MDCSITVRHTSFWVDFQAWLWELFFYCVTFACSKGGFSMERQCSQSLLPRFQEGPTIQMAVTWYWTELQGRISGCWHSMWGNSLQVIVRCCVWKNLQGFLPHAVPTPSRCQQPKIQAYSSLQYELKAILIFGPPYQCNKRVLWFCEGRKAWNFFIRKHVINQLIEGLTNQLWRAPSIEDILLIIH